MSLYDCELLSEDEITRLFESKDYTGVHNEMLRMRGLIIQFRLYAGGLKCKLDRIKKNALICAAEVGDEN